MKKKIFVLALFIAGWLVAGCNQNVSPPEEPPPDQARVEPSISDPANAATHPVWKAIQDGALLVDVRREDEFTSGHLDGAILIPHTEVEDRVAEFGEAKGRPIVVYCKSGGRSGRAKGLLEQLGFTAVINGGGFEELSASKPKE